MLNVGLEAEKCRREAIERKRGDNTVSRNCQFSLVYFIKIFVSLTTGNHFNFHFGYPLLMNIVLLPQPAPSGPYTNLVSQNRFNSINFSLICFDFVHLIIHHTIYSSKSSTCDIPFIRTASCRLVETFVTPALIASARSVPHQRPPHSFDLQIFSSYQLQLSSVYSTPSIEQQKEHMPSSRCRRRTTLECYSQTILLVRCLRHNHSHQQSISNICKRFQSF